MSGESVREARDRYLAENSLSLESYAAPGFPVQLAGRVFSVPNPGLLPWHDLHHVATGYGTGLVGEAEMSAFELRGGCGSPLVFLLCVGAIFFAMFVAPRRVVRAWRRARGARTLYHTSVPYEDLLRMSVAELRRRLNLAPADPSAGASAKQP
jgi:hypothetical protein